MNVTHIGICIVMAGLSSAADAASTPGGTVPAAGQTPVDRQSVDRQSAAQPSAEARLDWPANARLSVEASPYELVIRFDRPIDEAEFQRFSATVGSYLADLRWNDDSLVLRPVLGQQIVARQDGPSVVVQFLPEGNLVAVPSPADPDGKVELALAQSQADAAAGYPGEARRRLEKVAQTDPDDKQVQRALADAEAAEGRTADAAAYYLAIGADDPMARGIIAEAGGRARATSILRDGKGFSQWESSLDASVPLGSDLTAGAGIRHVRTVAKNIAGADGYLARRVRHLTIADATAVFRPASTVSLSLQASALLDEDVVGVGARLVVGSPEKEGRIFASYRLPEFSAVEQAVFGGHISKIGVGGTIRITPEVTAQADVALAGYGLPGGGVRTRTTQVLGGIDVLLLRRPLSVQISYRVDAEYVGWIRHRANGMPFIPLSDRENHTLQVVMSKGLKFGQVTAAAGWTKDRYGGNGPTASLGMSARLGDAWRLEASGGVSSISRQAISGRQVFLRLSISRMLGGQ